MPRLSSLFLKNINKNILGDTFQQPSSQQKPENSHASNAQNKDSLKKETRYHDTILSLLKKKQNVTARNFQHATFLMTEKM